MALLTKSQTAYVQKLLASPPVQVTDGPIGSIKSGLKLQEHPEGGYFVETDRDPLKIPNPFFGTSIYPNATTKPDDNHNGTDASQLRSASTTIFYYLDPARPNGVFHRNKGRTVHTLHRGRGVYILIHADEAETSPLPETPSADSSASTSNPRTSNKKARIETFTVGSNIAAGERLQWIVEGGKFKASFLLPDADSKMSECGLLISETVVPGFEYMDHDFLTSDDLKRLVSVDEFEQLEWMLREKRDEGENGAQVI